MFTSYVTLQSNVLAGYVTLQGSGQPCHSKQCRYLQKMKGLVGTAANTSWTEYFSPRIDQIFLSRGTLGIQSFYRRCSLF